VKLREEVDLGIDPHARTNVRPFLSDEQPGVRQGRGAPGGPVRCCSREIGVLMLGGQDGAPAPRTPDVICS